MNDKLTGLIAEDETPQRTALAALLQELWPELKIVALCDDGLTAMEALHAQKPNVMFLDIRMPGVSGIEVARAADLTTQVVFTTAYSEYALSAFEEGAADYLVKPIKRDRLEKSIARVKERLRLGTPQNLDKLLSTLQQHLPQSGRNEIKWITANAGDTVKMFPVDDVLFFQAQDKYTRVVTANDEAHIRTPLKDLVEGLNSNEFWQVHRSVIVRATAIDRIKRVDGRMTISMKGNTDVLPVSNAFEFRFRSM